jgi:hypothetical protein
MADTEDFAKSYKRYQEALKKANERSKAAVFDALSGAGVDSVTITFDGEGDSGQIEEVTAYRNRQVIALPGTTVAFHSVSWDCKAIHSAASPLAQALENLCYNYLSEAHGGWENDDGAYGEFTFDVAAREIELDFNARFIDSTNYSHTF